MRIALTADPELPVPPRLYGGIERIIDLLARGLEARGHEVTLFAHPRSSSAGRLAPWPGRKSRAALDTIANAITLSARTFGAGFDLVHSFSRIAYLTPILATGVPKLMTYQREISPGTVRLGHQLSRGTLQFSAISHWMYQHVADVGTWHMVPNGVCTETYEFRSGVGPHAPLVFLGRMEAIKGPHVAIEVARRSGVPLILAGNIPEAHAAWFDTEIRPHVDGRFIRFVGPVDDRQKNELLGSARAFLMPILWEEPFGIVMAEAMACGTPVIGFRRGAAPEVVAHGVTGFIVDDVAEMALAVARVGAIRRSDCRARVEGLYSADAVVDGYIDVYNGMLEAHR